MQKRLFLPGWVGIAAMSGLLLAAQDAYAQLPAAPSPVPGTLLDRGRSTVDLPPGGRDANPPAAGGATASASPATRKFSFGTAFRVDEEGHLVTNRHAVEGCEAVGIVAPNGVATRIEVVATDPGQDLALLAGPPAPERATLRADNAPLQGEDVLTYGFPLPGVLSSGGQLGAGMITAVTGLRNDTGQLQTDVPLQPGNSGGALLDRRGQVVGVVFAKLNAFRVAQITGDLPQNVNFAVQLGPLKQLLEAQGVKYTTGSLNAAPLTNQEIAARARSWSVPIACKRATAAPR